GSVALIDALTYGAGASVPAPKDQSLTRSPDADAGTAGDFTSHKSIASAAGRIYSPGTRSDGTPFGSPALTRIEVAPASATLDIGARQDFNARAFTQAVSGEVELPLVSFAWSASD